MCGDSSWSKDFAHLSKALECLLDDLLVVICFEDVEVVREHDLVQVFIHLRRECFLHWETLLPWEFLIKASKVPHDPHTNL